MVTPLTARVALKIGWIYTTSGGAPPAAAARIFCSVSVVLPLSGSRFTWTFACLAWNSRAICSYAGTACAGGDALYQTAMVAGPIGAPVPAGAVGAVARAQPTSPAAHAAHAGHAAASGTAEST